MYKYSISTRTKSSLGNEQREEIVGQTGGWGACAQGRIRYEMQENFGCAWRETLGWWQISDE
jgi:hypothetical protein